ncbi:MAG: threonine synthase [Thermaerobacter sp.]|nr:threonine synthase [Thermaerobacter sp.]
MGVLAQYAQHLALGDNTPRITLGEGATPLVPAPRIGSPLGIELYLKFEGQNPTGSFKDRGMVMAVAKAIEQRSQTIICASTGNTSAAAAAYAAATGLRAVVVIPAGRIALGKLAQAIMYGADIVAIEGNFDAALTIVRGLAAGGEYTLVNSINPWRIEGQKTAAFEVVDVLGDAPDILAIPVGNAGNITAYAKGFREYRALGRSSKSPLLFGFQAAGSAPFVQGGPIDNPETVATAIRIGNPANWQLAHRAVAEFGGGFFAVPDEEILQAQRRIAREVGLFPEPASAAPVAGLVRLHREGGLPRGAVVVAVLTGNGLKDPDVASRSAEGAIVPVPADADAVRRAISG